MSNPQQVAYKFGRFCLRPGDRQLLCDDNPVPLAPQMFDTLLLLVESQGRLLEKDEFLKRVWPDSFVEEVALAHAISHVRKALREGTGESSFIETVPKRGYRFLARVEILGAAGHEEDNVGESMTGTKGALALKIFGDDLKTLEQKGEEVVAVMSAIPGMHDIKLLRDFGQPNLNLTIDRRQAARFGINITDIQDAVQTAVGGS